MKGKIFFLATILMFIAISQIAKSQPPPPSPPDKHGSGGNAQPGAGAPVGSGVTMLILLSAAYGTKKMYSARKHKNGN